MNPYYHLPVERNQDWFPSDFGFFLTLEEKAEVVTICDQLQTEPNCL